MVKPNSSGIATLAQISRTIRTCGRCRLHETRTNGVPGVGSPKAQMVFVGEGPGRNEDQQGEPFVGRAGRLLDQLLASVSILREDVFITNIVKCRPPANRDPQPDEIETCAPYLKAQLALIQPKVIVTLGRHALGYFRKDSSIGRDHGQIFRHNGVVLLPMYHPAAGLRSDMFKQRLFEDFKQLPIALRNAIRKYAQTNDDTLTTTAEQSPPPAAEQELMF